MKNIRKLNERKQWQYRKIFIENDNRNENINEVANG